MIQFIIQFYFMISSRLLMNRELRSFFKLKWLIPSWFYNIFVNVTKRKVSSYRSSRLEVFCRQRVHRNFAKFTGKHLCQSLFFNKVAALGPATLLKKRLWHRCLSVNFAKFLRTLFLTEHPGGCFFNKVFMAH